MPDPEDKPAMDQPHLHFTFATPPDEKLILALTAKGFHVRRNMTGEIEGYGHGDRSEIEGLITPAGGRFKE